jgi:hypothetical protein
MAVIHFNNWFRGIPITGEPGRSGTFSEWMLGSPFTLGSQPLTLFAADTASTFDQGYAPLAVVAGFDHWYRGASVAGYQSSNGRFDAWFRGTSQAVGFIDLSAEAVQVVTAFDSGSSFELTRFAVAIVALDLAGSLDTLSIDVSGAAIITFDHWYRGSPVLGRQGTDGEFTHWFRSAPYAVGIKSTAAPAQLFWSFDSGSSADSWSLSAGMVTIDTATLAERPALAILLVAMDSAASQESYSLVAGIRGFETGTATDTPLTGIAYSLSAYDQGFGNDGRAGSTGSLDTFTDTNGTLLTSHTPDSGGSWAYHASYGTSSAVISAANRVRNNGSVTTLAYHSQAPSSADYDVEIDVVPFAYTTQSLGVCGRIDTASDTFYRARYDGNIDTWKLEKVVSGTPTGLGTYGTAISGTQRLRLRMTGSSISLWVAGVQQITATDSSITAAGRTGIYISGTGNNSSGFHGDSFQSGTITQVGPESVAIVFVSLDSGKGYEATPSILTITSLVSLDSWGGSEIDLFGVDLFSSQSGASVERMILIAPLVPVDAGTGLDFVANITLLAIDVGSSRDAAGQSISISLSTFRAFDSWTGSEKSWLAVSQFGGERGTSLDQWSLSNQVFGRDLASGAEGSAEFTTGTSTPWAYELPSWIEQTWLDVAHLVKDSGSSVEPGGSLIQFGQVNFAGDVGAASEMASVVVAIFTTETGRPTEAAWQATSLFTSDRGTVQEWVRQSLKTIQYHVYGNNGLGGPINYLTPIATVAGLTWTSGTLASPGLHRFGVRAFNTDNLLEEKNIDATIEIRLDETGVDISNIPQPPDHLSVNTEAGGKVRASWTHTLGKRNRRPVGFRVYRGISVPDYTTPVSTVPYTGTGIYTTVVTGLTDATEYVFGVRAYNGTGEEQNTMTATATTDSTPPGTVDGLSARAVES